jgi:hypothetical protein
MLVVINEMYKNDGISLELKHEKNFLFFHVRNTRRRRRRGYLQNPVINPKGEKLAHQKSPSILQSALI